MRVTVAVFCLLGVAAAAEAQTDPIRCWWRTSAGAVAIGEPFESTLTCAARDQVATRTVADESRLDSSVVQLAPFEVIGGSHPGDLRSPTHRFFQYRYTLRIIDRDVLGRDARFPEVRIPYRVHTLVNGEWTAGRERTYTIPSHGLRVLSLVAADVSDIRDAGEASFAVVETLRFQAQALDIATYVLVALGVLIATPAVISLVRSRHRTPPAQAATLPRRAIGRAIDTELAAVARDSAGGWTPDLVSRALGALRLAAAASLDRDIAVRPFDALESRENRLVVRHGFWRTRADAVSSAVTAADIRSALLTRPSSITPGRRASLEDLAGSLVTLTAALYSERLPADDEITRALSIGRSAAQRLAVR
jgi:hypothetical protein